MKKVFLISLLLFIFGFTTNVFAVDITFPLAELGNCNNVKTCKIYCGQPENKDACIAFAKSKGLYQDSVSAQKVNLLSFAKAELGCASIQSCRSFCELEENQAKCQSFTQKHGLVTAPSAKDEKLLEEAKQNLNCSSAEECKTLCDKQENYTKCAALLQDQVTSDERAMFEKYKPLIKEYLGCNSIVTCMAFCINPLNTKKCQELAERIEVEQGGTPNIESPDPEVWCPKVSSECKWDGTNCVCMGPETCAKANDIPGCTWDGTQCNCPGIAEDPPEVWCPKAGPGCAWDGKQCICYGTSETPIQSGAQEKGEVWCPRIGPYCVWDGSSCTCWDECVKNGGKWTGTICEMPQPTAVSKEAWCSKQGQYCVWDGSTCTCWDECVKAGGKWTGKVCEYQGGTNQTKLEPNSETPASSCIRNSNCKWTGETCVCAAVQAPQTEPSLSPAVQGTSTNRGLLQRILDFILSK